jgi:hypothetical protein
MRCSFKKYTKNVAATNPITLKFSAVPHTPLPNKRMGYNLVSNALKGHAQMMFKLLAISHQMEPNSQ